MQKLGQLKFNNTKLELFYKGSDRLSYKFYYNKQIISEGDDFRPSPMFGIDSLDAFVACLGFMTLKPGDTDKDYFKDHTKEHMNFLESHDCDELNLLINDFEDKDSEYFKDAKRTLKKGFKLV